MATARHRQGRLLGQMESLGFALREEAVLQTLEARYWKQWAALGFSPEGHPMLLLREGLTTEGVGTCASLQAAKTGQQVRIGGLLVRPHKPPTANGLVFFSLSDETALAHIAVLPSVSRQHSAALCGTGLRDGGPVLVTGRAETRGQGVSLLATQLHSLS